MEVTYYINMYNVVGSHLDTYDASCLVCHRLFVGEYNSWGVVARLRLFKCFLHDSLSNIINNMGLCWLTFA